MRQLRFLFLFLLLGPGLLGCDTTATQPERQVVVEAYLQAQAPLPAVRLSRTVDIDESYSLVGDAVRGADVLVQELTPDSTVAETVRYRESSSPPGRYVPTESLTVKPQSTYRLRAVVDGTTLTATTTVPGPVEIVETQNDTAVYQSPNQPAFRVELARSKGGENVFTFTTTSLLDFKTTPDSLLRRALTPFYADGFDPEEDSLRSLRVTSSGLLNEGNFDRNADGTISIELPWIAVRFFGPNKVAVNAVDENYYDFRRSQQVQQGGGGPGEIPNVIEHVKGGTGIFGSYARAARPVFIRLPERREGASTEELAPTSRGRSSGVAPSSRGK